MFSQGHLVVTVIYCVTIVIASFTAIIAVSYGTITLLQRDTVSLVPIRVETGFRLKFHTQNNTCHDSFIITMLQSGLTRNKGNAIVRPKIHIPPLHLESHISASGANLSFKYSMLMPSRRLHLFLSDYWINRESIHSRLFGQSLESMNINEEQKPITLRKRHLIVKQNIYKSFGKQYDHRVACLLSKPVEW